MSLLMDALKKAEQEKKEAAKRLQEAQEQSQKPDLDVGAQGQELSIEAYSVQYTSESAPSEEKDPLDDAAAREGLSLSPVKNQHFALEDMATDDSSVEDSSLLDLSASNPSLPGLSFSTEENDSLSRADLSMADDNELEASEFTQSESSANMDQTIVPADFEVEEAAVHTDAHAADSQAAELQEDNTVEIEQAYTADTLSEVGDEYFSTTVSAAQLAEDIGRDSPTPVAAQTVFTATASNRGNQFLLWGAFLALCLVIAVALSFIVFNYTIPLERSVKSPLVARDVETQSESVPIIEIPGESISGTDVDNHLLTGEITEAIEKENESVAIEKQAESAPKNDFPVAQIVQETSSMLAEKIVLEPKLIKISRSKSVDKHSVQVNKAYQEYLAGDYDAAEESYRGVLKILPENRDALLGLAAISLRKGHLRQAYSHYLEVLRLYPGDSVAEAALINFNGNGDHVRNESILKTFIKKEPDNSFLYYSLGHLYAAQTRWPEAQQSFFDAYKIETSNPDYAFNLAVSLDHIGQQQSAIDYYNAALKLVGQSSHGFTSVGFDRAVVVSRIDALSDPGDFQ